MNSFDLVSKQGQKYTVSIPDPKQDLVSAYVFAFARGGSTLLNNMVTTYCHHVGVPVFSLFNSAFDQGVPTQDIQEDARVCFKPYGYIYAGFRHFPGFDLDVSGAPAIWLTRDPRDMLVSQYYSVLASHVIPKGLKFFDRIREEAGNYDIDQYAISKATVFAEHFQHYQKMLENSDLTIYRYEDVIYRKKSFLNSVIAKLRLKRNRALVRDVARQFDIVPDAENEDAHIRQVHPGNYTRKLTRETIQIINATLFDFLRYFNYVVDLTTNSLYLKLRDPVPDYKYKELKIFAYEREEGGMRIKGFGDGSPFKAAGLKKGDLIIKIGGKGIDEIGFMAIEQMYLTQKKIPVVFKRKGKVKKIDVKPPQA